MAWSLDTSASIGTTVLPFPTRTHTLTTYTCDATAKLLIVTVFEDNGTPTVTGVTWNASAMTAIHAMTNHTLAGVQMFYLIAPATGNKNLVITCNGTTTYTFAAHIASFICTSATPTIISGEGNTAISGAPVATTTTGLATGNLLVGSMYNISANAVTAQTGTTIRSDIGLSNSDRLHTQYYICPNASNVAMSWTIDSGTQWAIHVGAFASGDAAGNPWYHHANQIDDMGRFI